MGDPMYERGTLAAHSSDESGLPDVGMSVGLGYGQMLYVGEVPGLDEMGIAIYTQKERIDVGYATDVEAAHEMMRAIAAAIRKHDAQDQALTTLAREGQRWGAGDTPPQEA